MLKFCVCNTGRLKREEEGGNCPEQELYNPQRTSLHTRHTSNLQLSFLIPRCVTFRTTHATFPGCFSDLNDAFISGVFQFPPT